ncbi:MAG: hypothetical protein OXF30_00080 [Candidatus Saccharibacteria bacterium]|nr:hypothetical protein [Candidatus Saccharibacteria bacterium]
MEFGKFTHNSEYTTLQQDRSKKLKERALLSMGALALGISSFACTTNKSDNNENNRIVIQCESFKESTVARICITKDNGKIIAQDIEQKYL